MFFITCNDKESLYGNAYIFSVLLYSFEWVQGMQNIMNLKQSDQSLNCCFKPGQGMFLRWPKLKQFVLILDQSWYILLGENILYPSNFHCYACLLHFSSSRYYSFALVHTIKCLCQVCALLSIVHVFDCLRWATWIIASSQ